MSNIVDKLLETASALNEDAYARYQERKLEEGNKKIDEIDKKIATEERRVEMGKSSNDLRKLKQSREDIQEKYTVKTKDWNGEVEEARPCGNGMVEDDQYGRKKSLDRFKVEDLHAKDDLRLRFDVPESKEPANAALHDRINIRSEKYTPKDKKSTQHESAVRLAELLVEAANILLETENK